MEAPAIVLQNLHKSFGEQTVLDGIDLSLNRGETVSILGRSGSGKSVLLKMLIGLQKPDEGSIQIHGREITGLAMEEMNEVRLSVGFLFQEAALYDSLTLADNVAFPIRRHKPKSGQDPRDRAQELLAAVGMEGDAHKMPSEISGGMKKRVGLARALALEPDILLFDEPTAGLDPITATEIEDLIMKVKHEHNVTAVIVTHDLHGAKTLSKRLVLIHDGAVLAEGSYDELKRHTDPFVSQFLRETA
jgi:phospholipid/cholesterol/gamma-HCH transport system ATP-binding protein